MKVLGVHAFSHDAGAAVVTDSCMHAISLERLSRVKYDGSFPTAAIEYVLDLAGITDLAEIDMVVVDALGGSFGRTKTALEEMGFKCDIRAVSHHDAHAASAFHTSPFDEAAILVIDACGSFSHELPEPRPNIACHELSRELQSCHIARDGRITEIMKTFSAPGHSIGIGTMYAVGALMSSFSDLEGGKLMALAAFGKRNGLFPRCRIENFDGNMLAPGDPEHDPLIPEHLSEYAKLYFRNVKPRRPEEPLLQVHSEIAKTVQEETSLAAIELANLLHAITKCDNLCIAGGFGLNGLTNNAYLTRTPFKHVYIQPAATDSGIPLGAALHGYHALGGNRHKPIVFKPFLGKTYSKTEIVEALNSSSGITLSEPENVFAAAAELISNGKIGGWFQGASEHGPRALGNRSIVADPRNPETVKRLNTSIKIRESFRPYAPAILEEKCADYFDFNAPSPHMLFIANTRPDKIRQIPCVVHVDGTARLQTVTPESNERFHRLIEAFYKLTGVPLILNTSFNRRGEPIVETPIDALDCFLHTDLDFLVMEDFLITKS